MMRMTNFSVSQFEKFISEKELLCVDRYTTTQFLENKIYKNSKYVVFSYDKYTEDGELYVEMIQFDKKQKDFINEQMKDWENKKKFWKIEKFKDRFPWGTIIKIIDSNEPELHMGMMGRVGFVDDNGMVQMAWNNGCKRSLNIESDVFMRIY